MGQCHNSYKAASSEKKYFSNRKDNVSRHFSNSKDFLENSSEWIVIFESELGKYADCEWSQPIFSILQNWTNEQDSSIRVAFIWNQLKSSKNFKKIDQSRACEWPQSIANLQTFTYEVESNPSKKLLNSLILHKKHCTIFKLIQTFKTNILKFYSESFQALLTKSELSTNLAQMVSEIDEIVLDFIQILVKILPKFFIEFPPSIQDIEEIVRNAVVSEDILKMLIMLRKELFKESQQVYMKGLQEFDNNKYKCPIAEKLEKDKDGNYLKAMKSLLEITQCRSIGEVHDSVAMLMNYVSMGLYDEDSKNNILEEDEIIQAFLVVVGKSSVAELPVYVDILNTFLDNNTLNVKSVGQGIVKLTYIIDNSTEWSSFLSN